MSNLAVCSHVPSVRAHCQKWSRDYELHWKRRCHSNPHIQMKENQFQDQNLCEETLFCPHLTEVYIELPRTSRPKYRLRWSAKEWTFRKESLVCTVQCHPQTYDERQSGDWLHQKEAEYTEWRELSQGGTPGDPTSQKWRRGFYSIHSYYLCPVLQVGTEEGQGKITNTKSAFRRMLWSIVSKAEEVSVMAASLQSL